MQRVGFGQGDEAPDFCLYNADTEPGSSGSPVYDAQWKEVIALHHRSADDENHKNLNRGIMMSSIVRFLVCALRRSC